MLAVERDLRGASIAKADAFTRTHLDELTALALALKRIAASPEHRGFDELRGVVVAPLFFENSSRTYGSFVAATERLGGSVAVLPLERSSLATKGESFSDTIATMDAYSDILVLRHPAQDAIDDARQIATRPVINAGNGVGEHPTQALLDVVTIQAELGSVNGKTVVFVGDLKHGRTVHSLARTLTRYNGVTVVCVSAPELQMPAAVLADLSAAGVPCEVHDRLSDEVISRCDVLYVTRLQRERFESTEAFEAQRGRLAVSAATLRAAKRTMAVLHPLPRNEELAIDVDSDPRAAYFRQMNYGMYARMALLLAVAGRVSPQLRIAAQGELAALTAPSQALPSLACALLGRAFDNPLMNAAGVMCMTTADLDAMRRSGAGAHVTKSCTPAQRDGNPAPRYAEYNGGACSVNSMGLPNEGFEYYRSYAEALSAEDVKAKPIFFSVCGLTMDESVEMARQLSPLAAAGKVILELNVSCPNVPGKPQVGYDFDSMAAYLTAVAAVHDAPFGVKLPPYFDFAHFDAAARVLNACDRVAFVTCINSLGNGLMIDVDAETTLIHPKGGFGGVGGDAALPIALSNVRAFALRCPAKAVVGCGGVSTGEHAFMHILAGATLVQVGTALHHEGPGAMQRIATELATIMRQKGYASVDAFRGKLKELPAAEA